MRSLRSQAFKLYEAKDLPVDRESGEKPSARIHCNRKWRAC